MSSRTKIEEESIDQSKPFKLMDGASMEKGRDEGEFVIFGEAEINDDFLPMFSGPDSMTLTLMKPGVGGVGVNCSCSKSGACNIVITINGTTGKKKINCKSGTCTGSCGMSISLPRAFGDLFPA